MKSLLSKKKKIRDYFEQAKITAVDRLSGRISIFLRNGLTTAATYLYDVDDLRAGMSVVVTKVDGTYVIMDKAPVMPRTGVSYSMENPIPPIPPIPPTPEVIPYGTSFYYSLDGVTWELMVTYPSFDTSGVYLVILVPGPLEQPYSGVWVDDLVIALPEKWAGFSDSFTGPNGSLPDPTKWQTLNGKIQNNILTTSDISYTKDYWMGLTLQHILDFTGEKEIDVRLKTYIPPGDESWLYFGFNAMITLGINPPVRRHNSVMIHALSEGPLPPVPPIYQKDLTPVNGIIYMRTTLRD
jgi:hypothetical protein